MLRKEFRYVKPEVKSEETPDENGITDSMVEFDWERDVAPQVSGRLFMVLHHESSNGKSEVKAGFDIYRRLKSTGRAMK